MRRMEDAVRARRGDDEAATVRPRVERPAEILALEEQLGERLGSPVRIDYGKRGSGKLVVRFSSIDDLERIYRALSG